MNLFFLFLIGHLQIDGSTLRTLCIQHGPLQHFHLYLNHGIALCKYASHEESNKAQMALNNCVLGNATICAESPSESEVQNILQHLSVPSSSAQSQIQVQPHHHSTQSQQPQSQRSIQQQQQQQQPQQPITSSSGSSQSQWRPPSQQGVAPRTSGKLIIIYPFNSEYIPSKYQISRILIMCRFITQETSPGDLIHHGQALAILVHLYGHHWMCRLSVGLHLV